MNLILRSMKNRAERDFAGAQRPEKQASAPPEDLDIAALGFPAGDGYALYADLYRQKDRDGAPMPVAVMVHGGGLFTGSRSANRAFCEVLARRGFLVFAPDYRLLDAADGSYNSSYMVGKLLDERFLMVKLESSVLEYAFILAIPESSFIYSMVQCILAVFSLVHA